MSSSDRNGARRKICDIQEDRIQFTVPENTFFSIPVAEALTEPPEDPTNYIQVPVERSNGITLYWISKHSLSLRAGSNKAGSYATDSPESQSWWRKDRIDLLERKNKKLQVELKSEQAECAALRAQNENVKSAYRELRHRFYNLGRQFDALSSLAERASVEAKEARESRANEKRAWEHDRQTLSDHIVELRGGLDEMKITEEELMREYEQLLRLIDGCVAALPHTIPEDKLQCLTYLRVRFEMDASQIGAEPDEVDTWLLGSALLRHVLRATEPKTYSSLAGWMQSDRTNMAQAIGDILNAMQHDMASKIDTDLYYASRGQDKGQGGKGKQKMAPSRPKMDTTILARAFYRWRADTTRLLTFMNTEYPLSNGDGLKAELVELVARKFLQELVHAPIPRRESLLPASDPLAAARESSDKDQGQNQDASERRDEETEDLKSSPEHGEFIIDANSKADDPVKSSHVTSKETGDSHSFDVIEDSRAISTSPHLNELDPVDPMVIFKSAYETDDKGAQSRKKRFVAQLEKCVLQALKMFTRLRASRANYTLMWTMGSPFNPDWMDIIPKLPEKVVRKLPKGLVVHLCKYPALLKYGNDEGKDYHACKCIKKAEVIVPEALSYRSRSVSDDQVIEADPLHDAEEAQSLYETGSPQSVRASENKSERDRMSEKRMSDASSVERDATALPKHQKSQRWFFKIRP